MRPDHILPDHADEVQINGTTVRKGSVGAFLANAVALHDPAVTAAARDALLGDIEALLPALRHVHIIRTWSGVEGYLPDHHPVIGPSSTQPGLLHGFGFCGAGFQIGPAAGEALAELVLHGRSNIDLDAFSIARFTPRPAVSTISVVGTDGTDTSDLLSSHPERKIS